MSATKGYYSLVQYCPDLARQEAANVGVVLFCPGRAFIRAKTADSIRRIRKFFGEDGDGCLHLNAMKQALVTRLEIEQARFRTLEDFQQFADTRANKIILTQPKPVLVMEPEADLNALFLELVATPRKPPALQTSLPLRKRLDQVLTGQSLKPFIHTKVEVQVPALKERLVMPYAFQQDRFSLIRPVEFKHQNEAGVKTAACKHAIEGLTIYKHPHATFGQLQLIVVADFASAPPGAGSMVEDIFAESDVRLFTRESLDNLKEEILTRGRPMPSS